MRLHVLTQLLKQPQVENFLSLLRFSPQVKCSRKEISQKIIKMFSSFLHKNKVLQDVLQAIAVNYHPSAIAAYFISFNVVRKYEVLKSDRPGLVCINCWNIVPETLALTNRTSLV